MFEIKVANLHWKENMDESLDLCLHGDAWVKIGDEVLEYKNAAVSATALYLLKTLTEDHIYGEDNQMLPCCGHFMIPDDTLTEIRIIGCPYGVDWSVIHDGEAVKLVTESKKETRLLLDEYRRVVFDFADQIEVFYQNSKDKIFEDDLDQKSYLIFWNEWRRRRYA